MQLTLNLDQIRKDTLGCEQAFFLNSAGSSLMPRPVVSRMTAYWQEEELHGGYEEAARFASEIKGFYVETARLLNCEAANIAFAYNATQAYFQALSSIPLHQGDYLLTSSNDYASNQIAFLSLQKCRG